MNSSRSQAPLYGHPPNTGTSLLRTVFLIPSPNIFSKFNPVNKVDTLLIRTLSKVRINGICLYPGVTLNQYSQTPLIRTLRGHSESVLINRVSVLSGLNLEKMKGLGIRKTFRINELSVKRGSTVPDLA